MSQDGNAALKWAFRRGHLEVIMLLTKNGMREGYLVHGRREGAGWHYVFTRVWVPTPPPAASRVRWGDGANLYGGRQGVEREGM